MIKHRTSRFDRNIEPCENWASIRKAFDSLPIPAEWRDENGEVVHEGWLYRGHDSTSYLLEPTIERVCEGSDWAELEQKVLREFQSKASMHMDPSRLPAADCKLSWLATIQHYGGPTRLLDFTHSPYVALYFALRNRERGRNGPVEVWGIDRSAILGQSEATFWEAEKAVREKQGKSVHGGIASINPVDFHSGLQSFLKEEGRYNTSIRNALNPDGVSRELFRREGLVAVAFPPTQNLRLSSQQGVFLLNGAEDLSLEASLEKMMTKQGDDW